MENLEIAYRRYFIFLCAHMPDYRSQWTEHQSNDAYHRRKNHRIIGIFSKRNNSDKSRNYHAVNRIDQYVANLVHKHGLDIFFDVVLGFSIQFAFSFNDCAVFLFRYDLRCNPLHQNRNNSANKISHKRFRYI